MTEQQTSLLSWLNRLDDLTVLGLLLSLAGVAMLLYLWQSRRSRAERMVLELEALIGIQQTKLEAQNSALSVLGQRVIALEDYLEMVGSRQQQLSSEKRDPRFYQQAIRLAEQGLDAEALIKQCGISRSEAELLAAVRAAH